MNILRIILLFFGNGIVMLFLLASIGVPLAYYVDATAEKKREAIRAEKGDEAADAYWNSYASRASCITTAVFFGAYIFFFILLCVISYLRGELT